jgi:hypothetical protein
MLAADKLQLQSAFKQQATALKEKEFSLHHNNLMTVGTQAAVLAGLDITMLIEFVAPDNSQWPEDLQILARILKIVYYAVTVGAFCANMSVVAHTTSLSVLGGSLALRGPDGSMMVATDALYSERQAVFYAFGIGLISTMASVLVLVWLLLPMEGAVLSFSVTMLGARRMYINHRRVSRALLFDESQTVSFNDIFEHLLPFNPHASSTSAFRQSVPRIPGRKGPPYRSLSGPARTDSHDNDNYDEEEDDSYMDDDDDGDEQAMMYTNTQKKSGQRHRPTIKGSSSNNNASVKRRAAPFSVDVV